MATEAQIQLPAQLRDSELQWLGVNMRADPDVIEPGRLSYAENTRFENGRPTTRPGLIKPLWAQWMPSAAGCYPWDQARGFGGFQDPNGGQWLLVATAAGVYILGENNPPRQLGLPPGVTISSRCIFVQGYNQVFLLRGRHFRPLILRDLATGFEDIPEHWQDKIYPSATIVAYGPWLAISGITAAGNLATVTTTDPHGYVTGQDVVLGGDLVAPWAGRYAVTVTGLDTFTYVFAGGAGGAAVGADMQCSNQMDFWDWNDASDSILDAVPGVASDGNLWVRNYAVLPNCSAGAFINNRLLLATAYQPGKDQYDSAGAGYSKTDFLIATDILDPVRFQWTNDFRINAGSDDEIVDLIKFTDDSLIVCKDRSWGILSNLAVGLAGDLSGVHLDMRGREYGLSAPGAITQAGTDIVLLAGKRGIVSLRQSEAGKVQALDLPLSHPVDPAIDRINWEAARTTARLAYWRNRIYAALPLDGATQNNAILVYDALTQAWAGMDTGPGQCPREFLLAEYRGVQRLYFLGTDGYVSIMEETDDGRDQVGAADGLGWSGTVTRWRTRRYFGDAQTWLRSVALRLALGTLDPCYSVRLIFPGAMDDKRPIVDRTKSATQYLRPWNARPWDPTNINDDHGTPWRQDYRVSLQGEAGLNCGSGIDLAAMQETPEQFHASANGARGVQVEITNTTGRADLRALSLTATRGRDRKGATT